MTVSKLAPDFSMSPQITAADLPVLAAQGFRAVLCARPDGEAAGQPPFDEIAQAARATGMAAIYIPLTGPPSPDALKSFNQAWGTLPKPVLGYCRSGQRAAGLWAASQAGQAAAMDMPGSSAADKLRKLFLGR